MIGQAASRGLSSRALSGWREVLAPPTPRRADSARQRPRRREQEWLRQHESEHAGQWVALDGGRLLAAGDDLQRVMELVRGYRRARNVLLCRIPPERPSAPGHASTS
ncbi:MAG: DUF5678 domain-containing protein [Armatimonadota bacterium]